METDLLPVLEAVVQYFVVLDHLRRLVNTCHVCIVVSNSLRSGEQ
jgi:hypothetical protein